MGEQSMHLKDDGNSNEIKDNDTNNENENMSEDDNDEFDDMSPEGNFQFIFIIHCILLLIQLSIFKLNLVELKFDHFLTSWI